MCRSLLILWSRPFPRTGVRDQVRLFWTEPIVSVPLLWGWGPLYVVPVQIYLVDFFVVSFTFSFLVSLPDPCTPFLGTSRSWKVFCVFVSRPCLCGGVSLLLKPLCHHYNRFPIAEGFTYLRRISYFVISWLHRTSRAGRWSTDPLASTGPLADVAVDKGPRRGWVFRCPYRWSSLSGPVVSFWSFYSQRLVRRDSNLRIGPTSNS